MLLLPERIGTMIIPTMTDVLRGSPKFEINLSSHISNSGQVTAYRYVEHFR